MGKQLVVNVIGGLCNRMRTIATGVHLADVTGRDLTIVWSNNNDLRANYNCLFHPLPARIKLQQPGYMEYALKWEMPRKRNLYLSSIYQQSAFSDTYSDSTNLGSYAGNEQLLHDAITSATGNVLIISGSAIGGFSSEQFRSLFHPAEAVTQLIESKTAGFNKNTVGVHIRRTDNRNSIAESPLQLFIDEMKRDIADIPDTNFFVASDDASTMDSLIDIFGDRIICGDKNANRTSIEGMLEATADLWALSRTRKITGSFQSSYSHTAALIGDIPLKVVSLCGKAW